LEFLKGKGIQLREREAAQAFTLWLTRMRTEFHLQQLPSYGSAAAASAQGLVTHS